MKERGVRHNPKLPAKILNKSYFWESVTLILFLFLNTVRQSIMSQSRMYVRTYYVRLQKIGSERNNMFLAVGHKRSTTTENKKLNLSHIEFLSFR